MKKILVFGALMIAGSLSGYAQGFYFDIGLGVGGGDIKINGNKISSSIQGGEITGSPGIRAGYGPLGKLYLVGEASGIGHWINKPSVLPAADGNLYPIDNVAFVEYNAYLLGGGLILYPVPLIQVGFSIGYSFGAVVVDSVRNELFKSDNGLAYHATAAVDLGKKKNALLIGLEYFYARSTIENGTVSPTEEMTMFGLFFKYAYRTKLLPESS